MAVHYMDATGCPCCGQPVDQAHDPDTEGRWQPEVGTCFAGKALAEFRKDHAEDLGPGRHVTVRLLPAGQSASDPLAYDPVRARAEYDALQRRHGLA